MQATIEQIRALRAEMNELQQAFLEELKDHRIPQATRWEAFKSGEFLLDPEGDDGLPYEIEKVIEAIYCREVTMYDDFHCDRYQTISYLEIYDACRCQAEETGKQHWLAKLKDKILENGEGGIKYDW